MGGSRVTRRSWWPPRGVPGIDLQRRVFLHSYEAEVDPDGSALETILTAPLVVAQWINCQYHFSTVAPGCSAPAPRRSTTSSAAPVIAGHEGDLRLGLPWQSVATGERLVHEPMRLLAVIQAPLARIDMVIDRNPILQRLFETAGWRGRPGERGAGMAAMDAGGWRSWDETDLQRRSSRQEKWFDDSTDTDQDDEDRGRSRRQ